MAVRDALTRAVRAGASIVVGSRLAGGLYQGYMELGAGGC